MSKKAGSIAYASTIIKQGEMLAIVLNTGANTNFPHGGGAGCQGVAGGAQPLRRPVRWNMPELLTVSSVLGVTGVIASFLLFFLLKEYGFPEEMIRTLLFLKLIIAGHSTLYVTRVEGWFWRRPWPSPLLFGGPLVPRSWAR